MKKVKFKSQFAFTQGQRIGILFLSMLILGLLYLNFFVSVSDNQSVFDISSSEILKLQKHIDSLKCLKAEKQKPKIYSFNPNFITDYKSYTLGMTPAQYDRLKEFRGGGHWVNSRADFKRVTKVSDSLLDSIAPYFKFPEWVTSPKRKRRFNQSQFSAKNTENKIDLNTATAIQLQEVYGIGPALSARIIAYRNKIGGFSSDLQLHNVWGLKPEVVDKLLSRFTVRTPKPLNRMNVNIVSASDIATIPGVSFDLGKKIWEFVRLRGGVVKISELEKIEEITPHKLQLIELYLFAE